MNRTELMALNRLILARATDVLERKNHDYTGKVKGEDDPLDQPVVVACTSRDEAVSLRAINEEDKK